MTGCRRANQVDADLAGLLGSERGLDHVGIAVRDLEAARETFQQRLGFGVLEDGKLPNGIQNTNYYFEDSTYLETLNAWDPDKVRWLVEFLGRGEGVAFAALSTSSVDRTVAFLEGRGIKTSAPISGTIQTASDQGPVGERWKTLYFTGSPLPSNPLFFIAYAQPQRQIDLRKFEDARKNGNIIKHPNTAVGLKGVWLAVPELAPAVQAFARVGLDSLGSFNEPRLGATGEIIAAGAGKILLAAPTSSTGAIADELRRRGGPGLFGVSIEVTHLPVAEGFVARASVAPVASARGVLGISVWVPPAIAHGAWLEFFQP